MYAYAFYIMIAVFAVTTIVACPAEKAEKGLPWRERKRTMKVLAPMALAGLVMIFCGIRACQQERAEMLAAQSVPSQDSRTHGAEERPPWSSGEGEHTAVSTRPVMRMGIVFYVFLAAGVASLAGVLLSQYGHKRLNVPVWKEVLTALFVVVLGLATVGMVLVAGPASEEDRIRRGEPPAAQP